MNEKNGESSKAGQRFRARMELNPSANNEAGPSSNRKVRTVPPHAALEPTEPPSPNRPSNDSTLVNSVAPAEPNTAQRKSRPKPKLRYSTSESSWDDTDDEASDEDPPWWTFTQRGMHKLKLRNQRLQEAGQRTGTDDSGKEEGGHSSSQTKQPKRRNKRGSEGPGDRPPIKKGSSGAESSKRWSASREYTPKNSSRNLNVVESPKSLQRPTALPTNLRLSTPSFLKSRKGTETPPVRINMKRRYSAPSSPVPLDEPMPSIALLTSPTEAEILDTAGEGLQQSLPIRPVHSIRSLSIPRPPFMKRHSESLTDTEAVASSSIRLKAKRAQSTVNQQARAESQPQPQSGTSTPMRRGKEKKQTMSKLKLNLPDQVAQHFAHGWPHAGSWQDALYGYYDEMPKERETNDESGRSTKETTKRRGSAPQSRRDSADHGVTVQSPGMDGGSDTGSPAPRAQRVKSRRRRYRQALAPPTPSGLGFTDAEKGHGPGQEAWKQGRVGDDEFDWGTSWNGNGNGDGHGKRHDHNRITEESADLSRSETRQTTTEKVGTATRKAGAKIKGKVVHNDGMNWKQRLRRIMFLDARVTIWIRFANLAVVVCSLALAITIREELFDLRLPGLVGPSTTLIIAYSCLTIVHIFIAVYREYFGRPIGLWGLRSKMLWVCLDLLFVALWSSGLTLQINDLIDTPLDCVKTSPWWEEGRSSEYAALLDDLDVLRLAGSDLMDVGVSETLGIILPDEITASSLAREACRRQEGGIALALMTLLLYGGNMVLSLFRIFETVRRTAHVDRAVMF